MMKLKLFRKVHTVNMKKKEQDEMVAEIGLETVFFCFELKSEVNKKLPKKITVCDENFKSRRRQDALFVE